MSKTKTAQDKQYTLEVDKDTVRDLWDLPFGGNPDEGIEIVEDKIIDNTRWSIHHDLIVRINGKLYETSFSVGATERQDETPWQYDDTVTFYEVEAVSKTITVYQRLK